MRPRGRGLLAVAIWEPSSAARSVFSAVRSPGHDPGDKRPGRPPGADWGDAPGASAAGHVLAQRRPGMRLRPGRGRAAAGCRGVAGPGAARVPPPDLEGPGDDGRLDDLDDPGYPGSTTGRAAEALGVRQAFLRCLDAAGVVQRQRTAGRRRHYTRRQLALAARVRELLDQGSILAAARRILALEDGSARRRSARRSRLAGRCPGASTAGSRPRCATDPAARAGP
jgi:MerR family transcriptional regulator, heat shock protein HspR